MAHQGRLYPLSKFRLWNGDAPYPYWMARGYRIQMPDCTGTLAPYLDLAQFVLDDGIQGPDGVYFGLGVPTSLFPPQTIILKFFIGWQNLLPYPRVMQMDVSVMFTTVPILIKMATFGGLAAADHPIGADSLPVAEVNDPDYYLPLNFMHFSYVPWGG